MKHYNNIIKLFITFIILICMISSTTVFATESDLQNNSIIIDSKISLELQNELDDVANNTDEDVYVSLWLSDVDNEKREDLIVKEIRKAEVDGRLITNYTNNSFKLSNSLDSTNIDLSQQSQTLLSIKRDVERSLHSQNNTEILNQLSSNYNIEPEVLFVSNYAPLIILNMNRDEILSVASSNCVEYLCEYEPRTTPDGLVLDNNTNISNESSISLTNESSNSTLYPYGVWQANTNIGVVRDVMGYTGSGIKIGLLENSPPDFDNNDIDPGVSEKLYEQFAYHLNNDLLHFPVDDEYIYTEHYGHANYVLSILSGFTDDYEGIAPLAEIYCEAFRVNGTTYFPGIENLIDSGVNVINASIHWGTNTGYDTIAKYLDYIVSNTDVTFCVAAGNNPNADTIGSVNNAASAYDVITVGNIDDKNTINRTDDTRNWDSMYYSTENSVYKPDVCAPGARAATYIETEVLEDDRANGGTSASCPIVTGICAQLMQAYPVLKSNPMLVKSVIMSSAYELDSMSDIYSTSNSVMPALTRECGPGVVDAYKAYSVIENNNYKTFSGYQMSFNYAVDVLQRDISNNKDIFLCLNWLQWNVIDYNDEYYDVEDFQHTLSLYDPNGTLVAVSDYQYDKKQFIRYKPTQSGRYTVRITRSYTGAPGYYPDFAVAHSIK